jgi:PAS domain S-box-containing protein
MLLPKTTLVDEKTRVLFSSIPVSLGSSIILAAILSSSHWDILARRELIVWNMLMLFTISLRSASWYLWRHHMYLISSNHWLPVFRLGVLLTGAAWGSSAFFMFANANPTYQALLAFTLAGLSSGALTTLAVDKLSAMGFVILAIMPLSLRLFAENGPIAIPMGAMSSLYVLFVASATTRARKNLEEQYRKEEKIQNNAKHTQAILDEVFDAIITFNQYGAVQSFNRSAEAMFGYEEHEVLGVHLEQLVPQPENTSDPSAPKTQQLYQMPKHLYTMDKEQEMIGIGRMGNTFPIDFAVSNFMNDKELFYICVARDISERKRNEELKNQFISTVSHELRTPLTSIAGALGILNSGSIGALNENQKKITTIAMHNSLRLQSLVNDLLDMEKLLANKMVLNIQAHCMLELVKKSIDANQLYAEKYRVTLNLVSNTASSHVLGDASRIQQVLANLLSNAAKFSYPNNIVDIHIINLGKSIRVSVTDSGKGIADNFRAKIFERFTQVDSSDTRQKGGSGLGLAISRELIQRMGGHIDFTSTLGKGSCFYFELPTAEKT